MITFVISQVTVNARNGSQILHPWATSSSLSEAKKIAKRDFKNRERWVIQKVQVVSTSED